MPRPHFTPATAREALGRVRPAAERLHRAYRRLVLNCPPRVAADQPVDPVYFRLLGQLFAEVESLRRIGVRVRDPRTGTVDFPARRAGREVWLRWRIGESAPTHWHDPGSPFSSRRVVDEDGPWEPPGRDPTGSGSAS